MPKIATKVVCIGQCLSYLIVALSDPGIAQPIDRKTGQGRTVYCKKCQFNVPSRSFHCVYCDVCIEGYDHHCPWTSKCIGKKNLTKFYVFLFMTPIFIVYCAFAFGFTVQFEEMNKQKLQSGGVVQLKWLTKFSCLKYHWYAYIDNRLNMDKQESGV